MDKQFEMNVQDNSYQQTCRQQYQQLYWNVDAMPDGPEKSVAKRKLLESLYAALRCHAT
jgi:hypothetical protein